MQITSDALQVDGHILPKYTCDGENISPPLTFSEIPDDTKSLAFIMDDPDAPNGTFTHWLLYNMSPATLQIVEKQMPLTGIAGRNDFGNQGYGGPCPPSGEHRYVFKLFALDTMLDLPEGATSSELQTAMEGHIILSVELTGAYAKA